MKVTNSQLFSILGFIGLFCLLYFGCETKTKEHQAIEKSRAENIEIISIDRIIRENKAHLSGAAQTELAMLEDSLTSINDDNQRINIYKSLASLWYSEKIPIVSGHYAEKVADILDNDEQAWSIAGTTYAIAFKNLSNEQEKLHVLNKSRSAFEKAISLSPENVDHQINLALSYVDRPLEENPMKGILMLVNLNKKYPENIPVLMQLGRLALGTNQLEKSVERLSTVLKIDPNYTDAHCLLAEVYKKQGLESKADEAFKLCEIK